MSLALCFNCGNVKFGALCECDKCGIASTGDMDLDILFSDWHFSEDVLSKFGNVIVQIQQNTNDKNLAFWTFLKFISNEYPKILSIDVDERLVNEVEQILAELQIERFEIA
ncbi:MULTISPECIES: hypothetical protein [Sulfurimonas]|uniref:Uncharacterized protein n=1 Tax=Sulfurimonas crateris TaxID=2574727 RepID=A0A4U2Z5G5_9BACT|nr:MULTISPECIES: hypothetical protein [Sulfurimonas]MBE0515440.1 hypothetical protein [Sulfurimonas sp.]TKI69035.1 hypothetical protein FCU45_08730 [Sulfurimonas crateris]